MDRPEIETGFDKQPPLPSVFMRQLRPEIYSDTADRPLYILDRSMLEFQLETVTSRNEHQKFEIFCRKLCERVICPNIRPQSGPEGGGDGKTDADTYPVAPAISERHYIGRPAPDRDNWGFAFSAMKDWKRKVVRDVEGIAGTDRRFERIYFVTNQPARAADRAKIEAELAAKHDIPVTILDRAWIANEVIDNERKDIAHDYLGVGQVVNDPMRMGPEDYSRRRRLEAALLRMTEDVHRPNHRLEARTSLAIVRLGKYTLEGRLDRLPEIWTELGGILDEAAGLAEFDADRLIRLIDVASMPAGRDPTYRAVTERLAEFVSKRTSEAEGALILLRQALRLDDDERFESIRLLGRAAIRLAKREHSEQLIEAQQHLGLAYRGADLLWAARSSIIFAAAGMAADGEEDADLPAGFVPTAKIWAWIALQLRLVPELILAINLIRLGLRTILLDEESRERGRDDLRELDAAFACNIMNLTDAELASLTRLPEALERAGMTLSRIALLFSLGHEDALREEGSIPQEETAEDVDGFFAMLKAQPVSRQLYGQLILNAHEGVRLETCISGMIIEVAAPGDDVGILLAQAITAAFEAMLATILEEGVGPHAERFRIDVVLSNDEDPRIRTDPGNLRSMIVWPRTRSPLDYSRQDGFGIFLAQLVGEVLSATFVMRDFKSLFEGLFSKGNASDRISSVMASLTGIKRLSGQDVVRIDDADLKSYEVRERPAVTHIELPPLPDEDDEDGPAVHPSDGPPSVSRHRRLRVQSVIDVHSWNQARWAGVLYAGYGPDVPPFFALMFSDAAAARRIFERWIERFGRKDVNHEISVSVIRRLPGHQPSHYAVQITSGRPDGETWDRRSLHQVMNRVHVMHPDDDRNIENFIRQWRGFGCYLLAPAVMVDGEYDIMTDLAILKRDVTIVEASDIGEHDVERIALNMVRRQDTG